MIKLVSRQNLDEMFPLMVPGLERALTKTSLGKYWNIQTLYDSMVNFVVYGYYQEETQTSGIFYIGKAPLRKTLHVFWGGKDPKNKTPLNLQEFDEFLQACAQYFECQSILLEGRSGWGRMISKLGYPEDSRSYVKDLS